MAVMVKTIHSPLIHTMRLTPFIMLDVHVLVSPSTNPEWVKQCIESIYAAMQLAEFDVDVREVKAIDGHIGEGRSKGYALGNHPYVTCVDDDDYVMPDAFQAMKWAFREKPEAIFTPEVTLQNGHFRQGLPRHHLIAYRRDKVIDHSQWPSCGDLAQINAIKGHVIDLSEPTYVHRLYPESKARMMRRSRPEELEMARG